MDGRCSPVDWQRVRAEFDSLSAIDPEGREALLQVLRREDPLAHAEVVSLLDAASRVQERSLDAVAPDLLASLADAQHAAHVLRRSGQRIGDWTLLRLLGSGGMGSVYLVERRCDGFVQRGALKLVGSDVPTPSQVARFHLERQVLARLDHPGIARLIDGGTTDEGQPYLVMDYVDGQRLDQFCASREAALPLRLRIFIQVCRAVGAANRALVVHRDIKPANIVVDQDGSPRLLDFGIAKLLDGVEAAPTRTAERGRLLTPRYASPEQVRGDPVSTVSDVFALGVLLYEMISGRTPYGAAALDDLGLARAIVDLDPVPPFRSPDPGSSVSTPFPPVDVPASWRPDLEAVTGKAMRKKPSERYRSADEMADDVELLMAGQPIMARRGDTLYRWRKLLQRHRWLVGSASAVALTAAISVVVWQQQRDAALASAQRAEQLAEQAQQQARRASQAAAFLDSLIAGMDPELARGRDTRLLGDILVRAQARVDRDLRDAPDIRAGLERSIAKAYLAIGDHTQAWRLIEPQYQEMRRRGLADAEMREVAKLAVSILHASSRPADASELAESLHQADRQALGADDGRTIAIAGIVVRNRTQRGDLQSARDFGEAQLQQQSAAADPVQSAILRKELAQTYSLQGDHERARALGEEAVRVLRQQLGDEDPEVLQARAALAYGAYAARRTDDAVAQYRSLAESFARLYGEEHPQTLNMRGNLASSLLIAGKFSEGFPILEGLLRIQERVSGPEGRLTLIAIGNLATSHLRAHQPDRALPYFRRYLPLCEKLYGARTPNCAERRAGLGIALRELKRFAEAERELLRAYELKLGLENGAFSGPRKVAGELAELYRLWNRQQQSALWRTRADP